MFALTGLRNFSESTIDYVYKKENKETIIKKKEKKEKRSVAVGEVRSCGHRRNTFCDVTAPGQRYLSSFNRFLILRCFAKMCL